MLKTTSFAVAAISGMLAAGLLAGCSGQPGSVVSSSVSASPSASSASSEQNVPTQNVVGGWTVNNAVISNMTLAQEALFVEASDVFQGEAGTPVAVMASQVVAGTNWMYLCQVPNTGGQLSWDVEVVYEDLSGNASITQQTPFDLANIAVAEPEMLAGGWSAVEPIASAVLDEEMVSAWDVAVAAASDVQLTPMTVLGSQVVAGINYKILCYGTATADQEIPAIYVATLYVPLSDDALIVDLVPVDLAKYATGGEEPAANVSAQEGSSASAQAR